MQRSSYRDYYYRPQTKFAKVTFLYLSVSHSVHRGSVCLWVQGSVCLWSRGVCTPPRQTLPLGRHSAGQTLPSLSTTGYGQQAGGTHPTVMHSCLNSILSGLFLLPERFGERVEVSSPSRIDFPTCRKVDAVDPFGWSFIFFSSNEVWLSD